MTKKAAKKPKKQTPKKKAKAKVKSKTKVAKPKAKPAVKKPLPKSKKVKAATKKPVAIVKKKIKSEAVIKSKKINPKQKETPVPKAIIKPATAVPTPPVTHNTTPLKKPAPKSKVKVPVVLSPELMKLPRLPKTFHLKKQKGKLAPGEKRVLKTEVITHHVIHDMPLEDQKKLKPEPKGKYSLEYIIRTPVSLLYDFLTTPNGLAEWFADGVDLKNDIYTFNWDGAKQSAAIVNAKIDSYLRLRWLDKPDGYYFEFSMTQDEMTGEVSLVVTDFGDSEDDIVTGKRLWASQIQRLIKALGTY
ncbi:MAG: hypothetical protein HY064_08405 [Bacteroidetes bacterium]|nr:hypothetical protein [Bacteroidota bacterium]